MNEGLTGLERHEGEQLINSFLFSRTNSTRHTPTSDLETPGVGQRDKTWILQAVSQQNHPDYRTSPNTTQQNSFKTLPSHLHSCVESHSSVPGPRLLRDKHKLTLWLRDAVCFGAAVSWQLPLQDGGGVSEGAGLVLLLPLSEPIGPWKAEEAGLWRQIPALQLEVLLLVFFFIVFIIIFSFQVSFSCQKKVNRRCCH